MYCARRQKSEREKKPYRRDEPFFAPPPFTSGVICVVHKKRFEFLALGHLEPPVKIRETLPDSQGKFFSPGEKLCSPQRVERVREKVKTKKTWERERKKRGREGKVQRKRNPIVKDLRKLLHQNRSNFNPKVVDTLITRCHFAWHIVIVRVISSL